MKDNWSFERGSCCLVPVMTTWKTMSLHVLWFIFFFLCRQCVAVYHTTWCHKVRPLISKPSVYCQGARGLNQQCKSSASSSYLSPYATSSTAFGSSSGSSSHHSGQSGASSAQTASYASYGAGYNCTASTATGFTSGSQAFPSQQVCMLWRVTSRHLPFFAGDTDMINAVESLVGNHCTWSLNSIDETRVCTCINFVISSWSEWSGV